MNAGVRISEHAVKRFKERTKSKQSDERTRNTIEGLLARAVEVELRPRYRVAYLLRHSFEEARYLQFQIWIFVIVGTTVVTAHHGDAERWQIKQSEQSERERKPKS